MCRVYFVGRGGCLGCVGCISGERGGYLGCVGCISVREVGVWDV